MEEPWKAQLQELGERLCRFGYQEIASNLAKRDLNGDSLIELLNHRSRKVGDTALGLLDRRRDGPPLVLQAVLSNRFTHKDAKVRATNLLAGRGRTFPEAMTAYLHLLGDRSAHVVYGALFGVVFFQDRAQLKNLECWRNVLSANAKVREKFDLAIRALREGNPFLFSPGFKDSNDVWGSDRKRFADRIG